MTQEILAKLKELEELIKKDDSHVNKTMADFFKPSAKNMVRSVGDRIKAGIKLLQANEFRYVNITPILNQIDLIIENIDAETLLEISTNIPEDEQTFIIEVKEHIKNGHKLQAVKTYKDRTGMGLKECKDQVDRIAFEMSL